MREIRPSGSEGGGAKLALPTPIDDYKTPFVDGTPTPRGSISTA